MHGTPHCHRSCAGSKNDLHQIMLHVRCGIRLWKQFGLMLVCRFSDDYRCGAFTRLQLPEVPGSNDRSKSRRTPRNRLASRGADDGKLRTSAPKTHRAHRLHFGKRQLCLLQMVSPQAGQVLRQWLQELPVSAAGSTRILTRRPALKPPVGRDRERRRPPCVCEDRHRSAFSWLPRLHVCRPRPHQ